MIRQLSKLGTLLAVITATNAKLQQNTTGIVRDVLRFDYRWAAAAAAVAGYLGWPTGKNG